MTPTTPSEIKLAVLEERLNVYEQMMERIDVAIEKISETSQHISKMLAIHNERIDQASKTDRVIISMIEDIKKSSKEQHEEMSKKLGQRILEVEKEIERLSQFRWKAVGAIAIITFSIGIIPTLTLIVEKINYTSLPPETKIERLTK